MLWRFRQAACSINMRLCISSVCKLKHMQVAVYICRHALKPVKCIEHIAACSPCATGWQQRQPVYCSRVPEILSAAECETQGKGSCLGIAGKLGSGNKADLAVACQSRGGPFGSPALAFTARRLLPDRWSPWQPNVVGQIVAVSGWSDAYKDECKQSLVHCCKLNSAKHVDGQGRLCGAEMHPI